MKTTDLLEKKKILIVEDQFVEAYDLQLILENAGYEVTGIAHSVQKAYEMIEIRKPDLVFLDIFLQGKETGIDLAKKLKESYIGFIYISANSGKKILEEAKKTEPYGFIVKPFREQDVLITLEIACYRHKHSNEAVLKQTEILQKNIENIIHTAVKKEQAILEFGKYIQAYLPFDYMESGESTTDLIGIVRKNFNEYQIIKPINDNLKDFNLTEPQIFDGMLFAKICQQCKSLQTIAANLGIRSIIAIPVNVTKSQPFYMLFCSRQQNIYGNEHLNLLANLENTLSNLIQSMQTKNVAQHQKTETDLTIESQDIFHGMVGNSKKMIAVFDYIRKVAPSDTSVLILGESGTGKEKVAQCIHQLSPRKDKPFVVINCGAIPEKLAESILFGHEKGAFTGATEKQTGKFELANNGTIFLDEIGEMPIDLQVKLLRVLQEMEIERVGGRSPIPINTRIIAATNKNLEEEVAAGRFRMDLYYRLLIFPIVVPPLRERRDDIPALANHFMDVYAKKMNRNSLSLSDYSIEQIVSYHWPGNIRQLEHLIQRSILLTDGKVIKEILLPSAQRQPEPETEYAIKTIHENERDYIHFILKKCKGKVYGTGGAAELLDIPPSTLNSKIKKLGIQMKAF